VCPRQKAAVSLETSSLQYICFLTETGVSWEVMTRSWAEVYCDDHCSNCQSVLNPPHTHTNTHVISLNFLFRSTFGFPLFQFSRHKMALSSIQLVRQDRMSSGKELPARNALISVQVLWNVSTLLRDHTVSHPSRQQSSSASLLICDVPVEYYIYSCIVVM
jgi:hypothetical protein